MDRRVLIPQFASGTTGTYYLRALSRVAATARRDSTVNLGVALPGGVVDYRSPRSSNPRAIPSAERDDIVTVHRNAARRGLFFKFPTGSTNHCEATLSFNLYVMHSITKAQSV